MTQMLKSAILKQQESLETIQANLPKLPESSKQATASKATQQPSKQTGKPGTSENAPPANKTGAETLSLITAEEFEAIPK